ncbi:hypothetical protein JOQ06_016913 [Pogonophryne albipinna]|uniref:Uncharacterized protein n=1 Tax=Pogonophryne albipinna TaxID=1090488 RepID=A0AAD6B276_9TELE|nr:hypothetical protein JOQ06_016913 [Pogonophryne albipinna]
MLAHRLEWTDPPVNLLSRVQALMVDFFWDRMHWVPQSVLFLPKEEGGHGLVHLASRGAAFRLRFVQRFLTGPADLVWRPVARALLKRCGGLGLAELLFLMDLKGLRLNNLSGFYGGLFKGLLYNRDSEERILTLGQVVEVCGPRLDNAAGLASRLSLRSVRVVRLLLQSWKQQLSQSELALIAAHCAESEQTPGASGHPVESPPGLTEAQSPEWRALYKPPLTKRGGDLQWRILHAAVQPEAKVQKSAFECFVGAKMAIYLSRRNTIAESLDTDAVSIFKRMVKARLKADYGYFCLTKNVGEFEAMWCFKNALCSVENEDLIFSRCLN